ncbi:hypothetical protein [Leptolyngbya ohadii]|uniref:hypothetical protein n=1 Tax=Leptolyngbya ohadii TaxID=1962290 RepID=UPI000B59C7A7|nr:hypothetical protein [Leptolyngbya ohadii]
MIAPRTLVCQAIDCPYWNSNTQRSYGCQRYQTAEACHLVQLAAYLDARNEYALYSDDVSDEDIAGLKSANEQFLREDPQYQKDLKIQQMLSDPADDRTFRVRSIPKFSY